MFITFKLGMALGLSIIISLGAQNIYVIQQAIRNEYTYLCASTCFICDLILILLGATGMSALFIEFPLLKSLMLVMGSLFLIRYGYNAMKRGCKGGMNTTDLMNLENRIIKPQSPLKIILLGLSFSLLNPAAIMDTIVIIGGSANQYVDSEKYLFLIGSITASFIWFFGLATVAKVYLQKIASPLFWRMLDFVSGGLMLLIASGFIWQLCLTSFCG